MSEATEAPTEKSYDLITEDLVKTALERDKGQDVELLSFNLKPLIKKGENFLSVLASIQVIYHKEGSEHEQYYVTKINPCLPINPFTEVFEMMFPLETDILDTIIDGMNKQLDKLNFPHIRTPKLYARNLEKGKEAFIMDNLKTQGYIMPEKTKMLDLDHSIMVLKELGRFHASSLLYEETLHPKTIKETFNFKDPRHDYSHESFKAFNHVMLSNAEIVSNILKKEGPKYEKCVTWIDDHRDRLTKYFFGGFTPKKPFDVLVHGDCKTNNMLFRYDGDDKPIDMRFVDLQCSRKASPATDLNFFFYLSLNGNFRVEKMNYLLSIYYESFSEVLKRADRTPAFSLQELIHEVKNRRIYGLCTGILVLPLILSEDVDVVLGEDSETKDRDSPSKMQNLTLKAKGGGNLLRDEILLLFDEFIEYEVFNLL